MVTDKMVPDKKTLDKVVPVKVAPDIMVSSANPAKMDPGKFCGAA